MRRLIGVVTQSIRSSGLSPGASRGWRSSVTWTKKPRPLLFPVAIGAGDRLPGLHRGDAGRCFSALAQAIVTDSDSYAPITPPVSQEDLEKLVNFLAEHENVLVIAGAGCSTESGVPDYRGPRGAYTTDNYKPMTHQKVRSIRVCLRCLLTLSSQRALLTELVCSLWQTIQIAAVTGQEALPDGWITRRKRQTERISACIAFAAETGCQTSSHRMLTGGAHRHTLLCCATLP